MFKNKYRIVRDNALGYQVQIKKWWFPFLWFECWNPRTGDMWNSNSTLTYAKDFLELHKNYESTRIIYEE